MMNPVLASSRLEQILDGFTSDKVFKFLHVPVQSGSDKILNSMGRMYTSRDFMEMIRRVRDRYPGMTISTDLITGFPGETDDDHESSLKLLKELNPDVLNITRFSSRPGTTAYNMGPEIKGGLMKERSRSITALHSEMLESILLKKLGSHPRCLVTEIGKPGTMMARDDNYTPIIINGSEELLGSFVDVVANEIGPTYLMGGDNWSVSEQNVEGR
jgi:tRNA A37 methylthiotransferase MiaB